MGTHGAVGGLFRRRAEPGERSPAPRTAVVAILIAALTAAATLAALTTSAHGTPGCKPVFPSANFGPDDPTCHTANELVAGEHEERVYWEQIAGAPYPTSTPIGDPPLTPASVDFFSVRARNSRDVFAGGAACAPETPPEDLETCERVPVIYGTDDVSPWHEDYRSSEPGYVGAIAWIGRGRALAVGGSGTYPRREPNPPGDDWADYTKRLAHDRAEGAGDARAWVYRDRNWTEISDSLPEEMGGLTALDIWVGREQDGDEWGLAGDYGHIWEWEGGRFTDSKLDRDSPSVGAEDPEWAVVKGPVSYTSRSERDPVTGEQRTVWDPSEETSSADLFRYRVREIRIAPDRNQKRAFAFTAGCCGSAAEGGSRRIEYVEQPRKHRTGVPPDQDPPPPGKRPRWIVSSTDTYGDSVYSFALKPDRFWNPGPPDEHGEERPPNDSMTWTVDGANGLVKARAEQGAAEPRPATPSAANPEQDPPPRYVGSDGDAEKVEITNRPSMSPVIGNGVPDWKVGEASGPEMPGAGVTLTTRDDLKPYYGGLRPYCGTKPQRLTNVGDINEIDGDFSGVFDPSSQDKTGWAGTISVCRAEQIQAGAQPQLDSEGPLKVRESGVQVGPSWALNGIDMVDSENVGYAVGDRGAILRISSPPAESDPPSVGARRPAELSERSPYDEHRPEAASLAGEVPAIGAQPREEQLDEPRMVRAGSPDGNEIGSDLPPEDVSSIVMSRDGSEGWAIGPNFEVRPGATRNGGLFSLHHYSAGQWTRCDPVGIPGISEPDRACSELAPLYRHRDAIGTRIRLDVAARVPLEYDSIPANDDDFEVIALGSEFGKTNDFVTRSIPTVIRYSEGRWRIEDRETRLSLQGSTTFSVEWRSLACSGADECWAAGKEGLNVVLRRFDGEDWIDCSTRQLPQTPSDPLVNAEECGDVAQRVSSLVLKLPDSAGSVVVASAGERVYLAGARAGAREISLGPIVPDAVNDLAGSRNTAAILYKDYGDQESGEQWRVEDGGYDGSADGSSESATQFATSGAKVSSLAVAQRADGSYEGWAVGRFDNARWPLMRLDPESERWRVWRVRDASYGVLGPTSFFGSDPRRQVTLPGEGETPGRAYIATGSFLDSNLLGVALSFDVESERWVRLEAPGVDQPIPGLSRGVARALALAPDGAGGIWAAYGSKERVLALSGISETYFYNYTTRPPREPFAEVPTPLTDPREAFTGLAGARDGTLWAATDRGTLYRYDRLAGWERTTIPGWDPGRAVTRPTPIGGLTVGADGSGLAVGAGGRIVEFTPERVRLDQATGTVCKLGAPAAPCGTSFDLEAAAIATGGAAMVGGEKLVLLARPAGGEFARTASPDAPPSATITAITMPSPEEAWIALDSGQIFAGAPDGAGGWRWRLENAIDINGLDRLLSEDARGEPIALRDISLDESGRGFAVGDRGLVLERTGDPAQPWRRVESGVTEALTSVALPAGAGPGALIGGDRGLILTLTSGEWRVARAGDQLRPDNGTVTGVALLPGVEDGQAEAWAVVGRSRDEGDARTGTSQLLHYTSAPDEPLFDPAHGASPLADVPSPRKDEITFAAFGRSDCYLVDNRFPCPPMSNGVEPEQLTLRRIRDELLARSREPGGPEFSIWTGDPYETPGNTGLETVEQNSKTAENGVCLATAIAALGADCPRSGAQKYRRFNEQLTDYLPDRGLPLFGAVGARDLSETRACAGTGSAGVPLPPVCVENRDRPRVGENIAWRQGMDNQPAPWGNGDPVASDELAFEPVSGDGLAVEREDQEVEVDTGEEGSVDPVQVPTGGAATHYAVDAVSDEEGEPVARLVVADTSPGSLSAADPLQSPLEAEGGQAAWLERVLCIEGGPYDTGQCTREPDQQAIVVSTTPTYSYGPTDPTELQADAAVFESILLRHKANVVVSGRLGWNGRYWATAPGIHEPCPGEAYVPDSQAPTGGARACGQGPAGIPDPGQLASEAQGAAAAALFETGGQGVLPFVVASSAGGRFNEFAERSGADASDGLWRGYSLVRLHPSGDPRKTIVEQRPIFDWVGITANQRVVSAGERLRLRGVGREPIGALMSRGTFGSGRYDEIDSPAITHRYDLVLAHPEEPWRPCEASEEACMALHAKLSSNLSSQARASQSSDRSHMSSRAEASRSDAAAEGSGSANPCEPYLCLPERIATINRWSGAVEAGNGKYPDTFAVAILSVGDHVAAYPLMFEKSPSFIVQPLQLTAPVPEAPSAAPNPPAPPNPPSPPQPDVPNASVPEVPVPPPVPPIAASQPPEPQPPAPPAPPPPIEQLSPLGLTLAPPSPVVATPTAVIQPPTPPVNPAPPGGARREARQRQAAAQKSGADNEEGGGEGADDAHSRTSLGNDPSQAFARQDRRRPEPSFTPIARADQPSAWAQSALYTGGIALVAFALAAGWNRGRPTPRQRPPEVPAPALARIRSRR